MNSERILITDIHKPSTTFTSILESFKNSHSPPTAHTVTMAGASCWTFLRAVVIVLRSLQSQTPVIQIEIDKENSNFNIFYKETPERKQRLNDFNDG